MSPPNPSILPYDFNDISNGIVRALPQLSNLEPIHWLLGGLSLVVVLGILGDKLQEMLCKDIEDLILKPLYSPKKRLKGYNCLREKHPNWLRWLILPTADAEARLSIVLQGLNYYRDKPLDCEEDLGILFTAFSDLALLPSMIFYPISACYKGVINFFRGNKNP